MGKSRRQNRGDFRCATQPVVGKIAVHLPRVRRIVSMTLFRQVGMTALVALVFCGSAQADDITGAGSTFVFPILSKWSGEYNAKTGAKLDYQPIGSGRGIVQIKAASVDFGASDAPLKPEDLRKSDLGQFPLVIGGIVPVVNIEGVKSGEIKFTGALLADIFLGKVKRWNDPEIVKLNPDVKLPAAAIAVLHRSDSSGTTFNWVNYLSKVSPEWRDKVGEGTAVAWPTGAGGKGNEGVAALVMQTRNSIGYVEYAYVLQSKLAYGLVQNKAGKFVKPDAASFQAAAASADWAKAQDFYLVMTDSPGADAYPIAATAFVLIPKTAKSPARTKAALEFFRWVLESGQKSATDLEYVPLPPDLVTQIEAYWKSAFIGVD
jgi:phosphate transport system substrate-binding protein